MKRKNKFFLISIILALFCFLSGTFAYFSSKTDLESLFKAKGYVIKLNAVEGKFSDGGISISKGKTDLPIPSRNGYTFSGYSKSLDGKTDYSNNISDVDDINNREIYAVWKINTYSITYNLNDGSISGQKTNYNVEESFTLPTPSKTGYSFIGWTGSNGNAKQMTVTVPKGTTGNLNYVANWSANSYLVDVNPIIDGVTYNGGLSGYTFDIWINGTLVADDVVDWCQNVSYGSTVRVKTNSLIGRSTNFDETVTVGTSTININPTWTTNTYESHFYLDGVHRLTTYNLYGAYISTPDTSASALGYDSNFYYLSGFTPWTTWYQPDYAVGFTINISERTCRATFGTLSNTNANYQQTKFHNAGYSNCNINPSNTKEVVCSGTYSNVLSAYNSAWNILPYSGNGFSRYKDMSCDSGWSTYATR